MGKSYIRKEIRNKNGLRLNEYTCLNCGYKNEGNKLEFKHHDCKKK